LADLVAVATGRGSARCFVNAVVAIYGVSAVLCCLVFIGDFFSGIASSPLLGLDVSRSTSIIVIAICVVWPLALPRSLGALRYASALSVAAICLISLVVAWKALFSAAAVEPLVAGPPGGANLEKDTAANKLLWWTDDPGAAVRAFGVALFAFAAHTNAVPVAATLRDDDAARLRRISLCSVCLELAVYVPLALGGYLTFRGATKEDFILNYRNDDPAILAVRCLCGASMCIGVPINLSPAARSIAGLLSDSRRQEGSAALHRVIVTVVIAACTCLAVRSDHIAEIIGLIGGSLGTIVALVWPAIVYRRILFVSQPTRQVKGLLGLLVCASLLGFSAFALQLYKV